MKRLLVLLVVVTLATVACGDDDDEGATSDGGRETTETTAANAARAEPPVQLSGRANNHGEGQLTDDKLELEADDFYFEPTFVSAPQGVGATVTIRNEGDAPHTFTITDLQIDEEIPAGESREILVQLPTEGTVEFFCRFHADQGMRGGFYFQGGG